MTQKEMLADIIVKTLKPYFERLEKIENELAQLKASKGGD
jgi:uncharacterized protein (UPF0335 family)